MNKAEAIVGVWRVKTVGAPFPYHMFAFHSDGTMHQTNPPAGNTETSDTAGLGVWGSEGELFKARFEEFRLDLKTSEVTWGVVDCVIDIKGDKLKGDSVFNVYSVKDGSHASGPHHAGLEGERVVLPQTNTLHKNETPHLRGRTE